MGGMVGIVGDVSAGIAADRATLLAMRDTFGTRDFDTRGSADAGAFVHRNVGFAVRDRTPGDSPRDSRLWVAEDRRGVTMLDGVLFDADRLRDELHGLGERFRSRADVELAAAAYRQWGPDCIRRMRGSFALSHYDFRDERLFLAGDRFGVKPIYFAEIAGGFLFASAPAALLKHPAVSRVPCYPALSHYLTTNRETLERATLFSGIHRLQPAEALDHRDSVARIGRYWEYPSEEVIEKGLSYEASVSSLRKHLRESLHERMGEEGAPGLFLDGGVDSATLACFTREATEKEVAGLCGGSEDSPGFEPARRAARHARLNYDELRIAPDEYRAGWEELLAATGQPVGTPSDVLLHGLAGRMRRSSSVAFASEGANELLSGHPALHRAGDDVDRARDIERGRIPRDDISAKLFARSTFRYFGNPPVDPVDHYLALHRLIPPRVKAALLQPWVWAKAEEDRPIYTAYGRSLGETPGSTAHRYAVLFHRVNLAGRLGRLDAVAAQAGLEVRLPYVDERLVEAMFRVPRGHRLRIRPDEQAPCLAADELAARGSLGSKPLLRSVAERMMPYEMAYRPSAPLPTAMHEHLAGPWLPWVRDTLGNSSFAAEIFQADALRAIAESPNKAGTWLWPLMNLTLWGDRQFAA